MVNRFSVKVVRCIFLSTLFIIAHVQFLSAQWIRQSPIPTGQEITEVCFINPDTGWIFGDNGTVLRTNDGGANWIDQSVPSYDEIYVGLFLDSNHGWIALSGDFQKKDGKIYGTTDGGNNWNLQFDDNTCAIRDMSFINPDTGWALAYYGQYDPALKYQNSFLKTIDGGNNWFVLNYLKKSNFKRMDFINDTLGYIAGSGIPNLMKTVDGGMTWEAVHHASYGSLTDVFFTDVTNGYSCGNNFYYTHNSGASWNYTYCYYANGVGMYDGFNGWTFSIDKVYKVTNGGLDVDYQFTSYKSILSDISAVDSANAYVVGRNVSIFSTSNGGDSWQEISNGTHQNLYSVFFINENDGWAGGSDRTLLSTHDGGEHWTFNDVFTSAYTITDIQFINPDTGWLVNGDVLRSTDGGLSWSQTSGYGYPVSGLYFLNSQLGWSVGPAGRLYKSVNGGISWEEKNSGTDKGLNAVFFINENSGWIAGDGIVKKTLDGGETWEESYVSDAAFLKIQFFNESAGYILADHLYIKTCTGGESWLVAIPEEMTGPDSMNDLCFIDQDTGYLSAGNYLLKTTDGGATWVSDPGLPAMELNAIFFTDHKKGWIVGSDGAIYQTESGGTFSINNPEDEARHSPCIIFPNPSRDIIKIKYMLETTENVEIGIYTLQGTSIRYTKETGLNPGNYSFDWAPENLTSGIYLCKIRIGDFSDTEKIVYIK